MAKFVIAFTVLTGKLAEKRPPGRRRREKSIRIDIKEVGK